jgi:hypothetical protein
MFMFNCDHKWKDVLHFGVPTVSMCDLCSFTSVYMQPRCSFVAHRNMLSTELIRSMGGDCVFQCIVLPFSGSVFKNK